MTNFLIITSKEDTASINIRNHLLNSERLTFKKVDQEWDNNPIYQLKKYSITDQEIDFLKDNNVYLGLTKEPLIFMNDLKLREKELYIDIVIFASRHTSKEARPAFLIHSTGNWSTETIFGGNPHEISKSSAKLIRAGFLSFTEVKKSPSLTNFILDLEVTHHGPTNLEIPLIFMELGSSKKEWGLEEAGNFVAYSIINTIIKYLKDDNNPSIKIALGFGGTHYAPQFKKLILEKEIAISFICPKYVIKDLNKALIAQMINNTIEKIDYFIIDWKGTNSEDKGHLVPLLEEFDIPIKKTRDFK